MRFRHRDGTTVQLAYGTNVHPAETLAGVIGQLDRFARPVRESLGCGRLGVGLWLARDVATELVNDASALNRLRAELDARGLDVVTLNGFPYQGFHAASVKHAVYLPDWTDEARLRYTLDLADILAALMPEDARRGSISTLPLGWRTGWTPDRVIAARQNLERLADGLRAQHARTGRAIRVAFEPEPGCLIETTSQAASVLAGIDTDVLGVCLDACHLAVAFEEPAAALGRLSDAGLPVIKLQASAALQASSPWDPPERTALESFVEPRFLHQTREAAHAEDAPLGADDLPEALTGALPGQAPWRVHFHVPVHEGAQPPLQSTQPVLRGVLDGLFGGASAVTDHVEVETYTWGVLPPQRRPHDDTGLVAGIAAELSWMRDELVARGLEEVA